MKKLLSFILALAVAGVVTSCGGGASTPSAAAKTYTQYMADGDYEKLVEAIHFEDPSTAASSKAMLVAMLTEKGKESLEEKGGLKSFEIVSETISEDGLTAEVEIVQTFGDGSTDETTMDLVLVDGKWLMPMDK